MRNSKTINWNLLLLIVHFDRIQNSGREFHGVWGDFDVKITLDKDFTSTRICHPIVLFDGSMGMGKTTLINALLSGISTYRSKKDLSNCEFNYS